MYYVKYLYALILISYLSLGCTSKKQHVHKEHKDKFQQLTYKGRSTFIIPHIPYIAALLSKEKYIFLPQRLLCSVVIIHKYFALSAAHCFKWESKDVSRPYEYIIHGNSDQWGHMLTNSTMIHNVVDYSIYKSEFETDSVQRYFAANIAVIRVHPEFNGEYEKPIPIAPTHYKILDGTNAKFSGWSVIKYRDELRQFKAVIGNLDECRKYYRASLKVTISSDMICAYGYRQEPCIGDSGGPLTQNNYVIGITSFGRECIADHFPDVYTNIANYTINKWIHINMRQMYPHGLYDY